MINEAENSGSLILLVRLECVQFLKGRLNQYTRPVERHLHSAVSGFIIAYSALAVSSLADKDCGRCHNNLSATSI